MKTQHAFSCANCGSATHYEVGAKQLKCISCGHQETIEKAQQIIKEYSLQSALADLQLKPLDAPQVEVNCTNCGATSKWDFDTHSDHCPYCKTPIAKIDTASNRIQVEAIVPFTIDENKAELYFAKWIKKRWFAPNVVKQMAGHAKQFKGVYIPHWTFDTLTHTDYRGQRGQHYIVYEQRVQMVNGKRQVSTVPVTKIRWYPAVGQVRLVFDDILVLASMFIPKLIVNKLRPWRLNHAEPYTPEYVAGMTSKYYQLDLNSAFLRAKQIIASDINSAIRQDIGGDVQQIHQQSTRHQNSTYKLILLPIWYSAFEYKGKSYKTVINGQSGKAAGQYPKSAIKIAFAVIAVLILLLGMAYIYSQKF